MTLSMSLFDHALFTSRLFFPRDDESAPPPGARDHVVAVDGATLHLRAYDGPRGAVAVLLFHGNGEVVADYDDLAEAFVAVGARLFVVDYRGYGASTGQPSLRAALDDAVVVVRFVSAQVGGPVVVLGRSLGSACAAEVLSAAPEKVRACIFDSGFCDLRGLAARRGIPELVARLGVSDDDERRFGARHKVSGYAGPVLVVHGDQDEIIDVSEGRALKDAARHGELVVLSGRGHNDLFVDDGYWRALGAFLQRV